MSYKTAESAGSSAFFPKKQVIVFICWNHDADFSYNPDGFVHNLDNSPKQHDYI